MVGLASPRRTQFNPVPGFYNYAPILFPKWLASLAKCEAGLSDTSILTIGNSTVGGTLISPAAVRATSWPSFLKKQLVARGINGNDNSWWGTGNYATIGPYDPRVVKGANWTATGGTGRGFGWDPWVNASSTTTLAFTPVDPVDSFRVRTLQSSSLATVTINIDGGATLATVNEAGAVALVDTTVGQANGQATAVGAHTVNVQKTATTPSAYVAGCRAWDSTKKHVFIDNVAASGSTSVQWNVSTFAWSAIPAIAFHAPKLVIISLGINDWLAAQDGTSLPNFKTAIQALITAAVNAGADVLLIGEIPSTTSVASIAVQQSYISTLKSLAKTNKIAMLDLTVLFGDYAAANALGVMADTVHGLESMYAMIARTVAGVILSRFGSLT